MADFNKAYRVTIIGNEGGYNTGIGEKETYMGIDRGANPNWPGWKIIDNIKKNFPGISTAKMNIMLHTNVQLQANIVSFYKSGYWDTVKIDEVNDQQLAQNLFDCSVNQGEGLARRFMQVACNEVIAAKGIKDVNPLIIDRIIGNNTLHAFNSLPADLLMQQLNDLRLASYKQDAGYAQWGNVWKKRLINYA